jgi:hypothetical protein
VADGQAFGTVVDHAAARAVDPGMAHEGLDLELADPDHPCTPTERWAERSPLGHAAERPDPARVPAGVQGDDRGDAQAVGRREGEEWQSGVDALHVDRVEAPVHQGADQGG